MNEKVKQMGGMSQGKASHLLNRKIMFTFIVNTDMNKCHKCGKPMEEDTFSVEHKKDWLHSENPKELFFDISNIAFSHKKCNKARRGKSKSKSSKDTKFIGVNLNNGIKRNKKWEAKIEQNGKKYNLGYFYTDREAAEVYDKKAIELYGNERLTNKRLGLL